MSEKGPHCYGSVTVGERGQVVIPAEARTAMKIEPGDKLLVFSGPGGRMLKLMPADKVAEFVEQSIQRLEEIKEAVDEK